MAEEDKESKRVENKFKLSLLQIEKRFVDLETLISELTEKVNGIDLAPVSEIKQRAEDIEDLIMVEQAAIIELKKALETSKSPEIPAEVKEKLGTLEQSIQNLVQKPELQQTVEDLKKELANLQPANVASPYEMGMVHDKMKSLEENFAAFKSTANRTLKDLYDKTNETAMKVTEVVTPIDFDLIKSKIDSLKGSISEIDRKKVEIDLKFAEMGKKLELIAAKVGELPTEKFSDEVDLVKRDVAAANMRIDSAEKVYRDLLNNIRDIENSSKKFESLDKFYSLSKDIENNISRFKFVEEEMKGLSSNMQTMHSNVEERLGVVKQLESRMRELSETTAKLSKDIDKNKLDIIDRVKKDDVKSLIPKDPISDMNRYANSLKTEVQSSLQKELKNKIDVVQTKDFVKKGDLQFIYKVMKELDGKYAALDKKVKQVHTEDVFKLIEVLKKDVDDKINSIAEKEDSLVDESVKRTEYGIDEMEYRIQDLLDKIVYLETRLAAVEKLMENVSMQPQPLIIE